MPRSWRFRIEDILESIRLIQEYTRDFNRSSFGADKRTVQAVAYNLIIIGEAAARLPTTLTDAHAELPWAKMRGMRNIIAHEYFDVRPDILWMTATGNLPQLVAPLQDLLAGGAEE